MSIEVNELFKIIILTIISIGLPIIVIYLSIILYRINKILKNFQKVSQSVSDLNKDEASTQKFVQEVTSYTANNVIETQTQNVTKVIAGKLSELIASYSNSK